MTIPVITIDIDVQSLLNQLNEEIAKYENDYGVTSDTMYRQVCHAEMKADNTVHDWLKVYHRRNRLLKRLDTTKPPY